MKTFKQFLSEAPQFEIERFKADCAFTLEQLKGSHGQSLLYRGTPAAPIDWEISKWQRRVQPKDTSLIYHRAMNEWFKSNMGDAIRNWMFCTGYKPTAGVYARGKPVTVIFPIGKFEWVCSKDPALTDMTDFIANLQHSISMKTPETGKDWIHTVETNTIAALHDKLDSTQFWQSTDLLDCIKSKTEIMFKCDKYYCFSDYDNETGTLYSEEMQQLLKSL